MPQETVYIVIAIAVPFILFALTLAWGDYQTRAGGK